MPSASRSTASVVTPSSRSLNFWIRCVGVFGSSSMNRRYRGTAWRGIVLAERAEEGLGVGRRRRPMGTTATITSSSVETTSAGTA